MIGNPSPYGYLGGPLGSPVPAGMFEPVLNRHDVLTEADLHSDEPDIAAIEEKHRGLWSPVLKSIVGYWQSKRGDKHMPARKDIDPLELRKLLPNVYLLDVAQPSRYRYRLIGTTISGRLRNDATGRMVDETLFGAAAPLIVEMYDYVAATQNPILNRGRSFWTEVDWLNYTSVVLPLSPDDKSVTMMLGAMDFWFTPRRLSSPNLPERLVDWEPLTLPPA
ncbi:MAG: PAS domain-containing protein [Dongiaceae bacterium]